MQTIWKKRLVNNKSTIKTNLQRIIQQKSNKVSGYNKIKENTKQ